jgi:hypothetical protein
MTYEQVKKLMLTEFKRLCGVYPETFQETVKVVADEKILQKKSGRPSKISIEDQILMTLDYWREYRTYFHIGTSLRRRFGLRFNLIAGIYNYELYLAQN